MSLEDIARIFFLGEIVYSTVLLGDVTTTLLLVVVAVVNESLSDPNAGATAAVAVKAQQQPTRQQWRRDVGVVVEGTMQRYM